MDQMTVLALAAYRKVLRLPCGCWACNLSRSAGVAVWRCQKEESWPEV